MGCHEKAIFQRNLRHPQHCIRTLGKGEISFFRNKLFIGLWLFQLSEPALEDTRLPQPSVPRKVGSKNHWLSKQGNLKHRNKRGNVASKRNSIKKLSSFWRRPHGSNGRP